MTDQDIFEKLKQGDRKAMEWLYRTKRDSFVHFFMRHFHIPATEATDLAIDALAALSTWAEKNQDRPLTAQLLTLWISIGKKKHAVKQKNAARITIVTWEDFASKIEHTEGVETFLETNDFDELLPKVEPLVNQMKDPCHTILKEYYWEKKTDKQVSEVLTSMSESATKMKRRRCIDSLRKLIFNRPK